MGSTFQPPEMAISTETVMDNLYPALLECFAIIICGYLAGRFNIISQTETKGLNTFVGTFSLPALIFLSMAQLDLSSVNWMFLLSILVSKSIVFFAVAAITLLVGRPTNLGRAGLFAIFCTQSNDFAIGYPIVSALYSKTHPEYSSYLYLVAPVSLVILNPLGFILMEIDKRKKHLDRLRESGDNLHEETYGTAQVAVAVVRSIAFNPVVFMTALGMIGNVIFSHSPPSYVSGILQVLGSAFSGTALFLLGLRMVGKVHTLQGAALLIPGVLIAVKLLALPLVTREVISILHAGVNSSDTLDLSTYGFLYGTFPAAPGVFVFSTQYALDIDLIASSMVACTFISAPLMFVSAKMITINKMDPADYANELEFFTFDVALIGLIFSIWVLAVFLLSKKFHRIPHKITACLVVSQLLLCIGVVIWWSLPVSASADKTHHWATVIQFALVALGSYSSRLWTAFLAITLLLLQCRSLCFVLKLQPFFVAIGWGIPAVVVVILLITENPVMPPNMHRLDPNFLFGEAQAIVSVFFLIVSFVVTIGCLVLHQRYKKRYARYLSLAQEVSGSVQGQPSTPPDEQASPQFMRRSINATPNLENSGTGAVRRNRVVDIEDLGGGSAKAFRRILCGEGGMDDQPSARGGSDRQDLCSSHFGCPHDRREQCRQMVARHHRLSTCAEEDEEELIDDDDILDDVSEVVEDCRNFPEPVSSVNIVSSDENDTAQTLRHVVLLILLSCSMFVGLSVSIWTLVMEKTSGIYVELSFLDASLNFGQSIFVFAAFGLDSHIVVTPFLKRWHKWWYGEEAPSQKNWNELSEETKEVCKRFFRHHLANCRRDIKKQRRSTGTSSVVSVAGVGERPEIGCGRFKGSDLVGWLLEVGLVHDRAEGTNYGKHLLEGGVIRHVAGRHNFHDKPYVYHFTCASHPYLRADCDSQTEN
ncbi:lysosomal cholesterol signaling protein [Hetaerina americana]|uniref:lysosomal cholesterol signaling protein n=1 Tax=Hetaerina americana TaxID=62018 RepID=UPI003A7F3CF6